MKLREIAARLDCVLSGGGEIEITGVAGMEHAAGGELTFLANPKYAHKVKHTRAAAILIAEPVRDAPLASLVSSNPYLDFARALELFYQPPRPAPGVHRLAFVAETAAIGEGASIGPFAVVGERVRIGRNAVLHPHAVIYEGARIGDDFLAHSHAVVREFCQIGNRVILQNGVVVGGDGFGFAKRADGTHYKIVQSGVTVIEDDVEVQRDRKRDVWLFRSRDSAEWRGRWRRRLRVRQARRWHALQDRAVRRNRDRRRCGGAKSHLGGSRHRRRNACQARRQDRQSGADRARLRSRRGETLAPA